MNKVREFLKNELEDYSFWEYKEPELTESYKGWDYYTVEVFDNSTKTKYLYFRENKDKLEIELSEGSWYEIAYFEWTVKYFWMALLNW